MSRTKRCKQKGTQPITHHCSSFSSHGLVRSPCTPRPLFCMYLLRSTPPRLSHSPAPVGSAPRTGKVVSRTSNCCTTLSSQLYIPSRNRICIACWAASVISSSSSSSSTSQPQSPTPIPIHPIPFPLAVAAQGLVFSSGDRQSVKPIFSNGVGPCRPYVPCTVLASPPAWQAAPAGQSPGLT